MLDSLERRQVDKVVGFPVCGSIVPPTMPLYGMASQNRFNGVKSLIA